MDSSGRLSAHGDRRRILLSFDLEEFDIPLEHGQAIPLEEQFAVGRRGAEAVAALLARHEVRATFFTTAHFAEHHQALIQQLARSHEIASHGYYHSRFELADLARSRTCLEAIAQQPVVGFRRARFAPTDRAAIEQAGYRYNSSENPIWLPGRYNNFRSPRRPYLSGGLLNIPISASPMVRFPLFWLSFKNFPAAVMKPALAWTLKADGYLNIFFHPWEFADLSSYNLPGVVTRRHGQAMLNCLDGYLNWLKTRGAFITFREFEQAYRQAHLPGAATGGQG